MDRGFFHRHRRTLISSAVILVLALHAVPMLYPHDPFWPIMHWSMYKNSRKPGPISANVRSVFAVTSSGKTEAITPEYTGLSIFVLERDYFRPWDKGEDPRAPARLLTKLNSTRKDDPFVTVRLEKATYTVTDSGIVKTDNPTLTYHSESASK